MKTNNTMDRRFFLRAAAFATCALSFYSCTCQESGPRDPVWGKDSCAHCRMTISDKRFAAQLVGPGARWQYFDDLGCALEMIGDHGADEYRRLYVHQDGTWVEAQKARYDKGFNTPMNYGYGPVPGGALSFDEVKNEIFNRHGSPHEG